MGLKAFKREAEIIRLDSSFQRLIILFGNKLAYIEEEMNFCIIFKFLFLVVLAVCRVK